MHDCACKRKGSVNSCLLFSVKGSKDMTYKLKSYGNKELHKLMTSSLAEMQELSRVTCI